MKTWNKLKPYQRLLIITGLLVIIIVGFYLRAFNKQTEQKAVIVPVITPPKLTADQTTSQKLVIDWQDKTYQGPKAASLYVIKTPLVSATNILNLSKKFNFNNSNEIDTKRQDSYLWVDGQKSLSATIPKGPLTYQNLDLKPASVFKSTDEVLATAIKTISSLIDTTQIQLIPEQNIELFSYNPKTLFLEPTDISKAQFASLFFYQSLNNNPYLPPTPNNAVLRLTINTKGEVRSMEVTAGIQEVDIKPEQALKDFEEVKKTAQFTAHRLTVNNNIEEETDILALPVVHLKVNRIDLIYTSGFKDTIIQPAYRLVGEFTDEPIKGREVSYVITAF
jgi:hypothetical protein